LNGNRGGVRRVHRWDLGKEKPRDDRNPARGFSFPTGPAGIEPATPWTSVLNSSTDRPVAGATCLRGSSRASTARSARHCVLSNDWDVDGDEPRPTTATLPRIAMMRMSQSARFRMTVDGMSRSPQCIKSAANPAPIEPG
jgi:hypothetical protein